MKFVVADIHGEISKLKDLVMNILRVDEQPYFIFIGDYLDKGEDPYGVLKYLVDLTKKYECIFLMGNHEYIWLNLYQDFGNHSSYLLKYGGVNTVESLGCKSIESAHDKLQAEFSDFFGNLVSYWSNEDYIVVHSGILPEDYHKMPEDISVERLLFNRYDFIEHAKLFSDSCRVVFGHTGFYYPYVDPYKVGIDTSACYSKDQPLTAFCLNNEHFYNSKGEVKNVNFDDFVLCPVIMRVRPWRMK